MRGRWGRTKRGQESEREMGTHQEGARNREGDGDAPREGKRVRGRWGRTKRGQESEREMGTHQERARE